MSKVSPATFERVSSNLMAANPTTVAPGSGGGTDGAAVPQELCTTPLGVIGVQEESPIAWSADGAYFAFVSGNHSIYICSWAPELGRFAVRHLLNEHRLVVKCLSFSPKDPNVLLSGGMEGLVVWDVSEEAVSKRITIAAPAHGGTSYESGHESDVETMAWAYGGSCLITGSKDNNIKVWDAEADFKEMETIFGHKAAILALAVNEKAHVLASAGRDSTIKLWDVTTLAPEFRARRADDGGVRCNLVGNMDGHRGDVTSLAWGLANPTVLYSGARDNTIKAWNTEVQTEIRDVEDTSAGSTGKHRGDVRSILVFPRPGNVPVAPAGTPIPPTAPPGAEGGDVLLTGSLDSCLKVWSLVPADTGLMPGAPPVGGAAAGDDTVSAADVGTTLGGGDAGTASVSDWQDNTDAILEQILNGGSTADALLGSTDAPDRACFTLPAFSEDGVHCVTVSPAGPIAAVSSSANAVVLMRIEGIFGGVMTPLQAFQGHNSVVGDVELLEDESSIVTASADNFVARFNINSTEVASRLSFGSAVQCLSLGSASTGPATTAGAGTLPAPFVFAGGADYVVRAYSSNQADYGPMEQAFAADWAQRQMPGAPRIPSHNYVCAEYRGHVGRLESVAVTADGKTMVSGARDFYIMVWDLTRKAPVVPTGLRSEGDIPSFSPSARIEAHYGHVTDLRWSFTASTNLLASGGNDHAVKVWKVSSGLTGKSIKAVWGAGHEGNGHTGSVSAITWGKHASGELLFSAGWDKLIKVWNGARGELQANLRGHTSRITDLDTNSDGTKVVSVSADFTARVWSTAAPFACLALYQSQTADGGMASVSAGDLKFVTASDNGVLRVWPMPGVPAHAELFTAGTSAASLPVVPFLSTAAPVSIPALGGAKKVGDGSTAPPIAFPGMAPVPGAPGPAGPVSGAAGGEESAPPAAVGQWQQ